MPVFSPINLKFSQAKYSILSFYCTVLFPGCSAKEALKNILHRKRLWIYQETLQISVFASMFLSLVKKTALHFLVSVLRTGRSTKESLNHLIHRACLRKSQETLQILVFILIVLSLAKNISYFLFITLPFIEHV